MCAVALAKARAVARWLGDDPPAVVLGADTEVVLSGRLMGKPRDAADAARILAELRGQVHEVVTGVALVQARIQSMRGHRMGASSGRRAPDAVA